MDPIPRTRRLHQLDTYLLEFEAGVVAVRSGNGGELEVALDQTAFYAESGGQPDDQGVLAGRSLEGLREEEGIIWHRLGAAGAGAGPRPGDRVSGRVDRAVRLDHMRQHTGQHILSQAFLRAGGGATAGFHLGREESTIDLSGSQPDAALLQRAQEIANACVLEDRPIRTHEVGRAELDKYPLRREPAAERDLLRVIEIEDYDWSACGGTHARRSGEVGPIQILATEKVRSLWRVRFLAGNRTLSYWAAAHPMLYELARSQSVHWQDLPQAVRGWKEEAVRLGKEVRRLREERGAREAERLMAGPPAGAPAHLIFRWIEGAAPEELRALATRCASLGPALVFVGSGTGEEAIWAAARSETLPAPLASWNAGAFLRQRLEEIGGRGGGSALFAQGTSPQPDADGLIHVLRPA